MQINEGLIIAPNYIKKEILKKISQEKKLINIKIMDKKEFIQNYYGKCQKEALYFIMEKYKLNYEIAKNYINNISINSKTIKPYFDALKKLFKSGFTMKFDAMNAVTGPYAVEIFENLLGAAKGSVVNAVPKPDFGGLHPDYPFEYYKDMVHALKTNFPLQASSVCKYF